jgi:hypothetical protein
MTQGLIQPLSPVWRLESTVNKSPEEEENQYLSDERINEVVKKAKRKAVLKTVLLSIVGAGVPAYAAGYFNQPWLLVVSGAYVLWTLLRK